MQASNWTNFAAEISVGEDWHKKLIILRKFALY